MDKELLRIAIIATGLIIMVAMIVSAYLKDKQARDEEGYYEDDEEEFDEQFFDDDEDIEPIKKPSVAETLKNMYSQKVQQLQKVTPIFEKDIEPEADFEPDFKSETVKKSEEPKHAVNSSSKPVDKRANKPVDDAKRASAQSILQFSVITSGNDDFNVADVFQVLEELGLEYGSMKIFERIDENRFVHFGVASMAEPGTFPSEDLENHYCPGVIFFVQFDGLENPQAVFDDYVETATSFAHAINGRVLDHRRQPLTDAMVYAIRQSLENYQS